MEKIVPQLLEYLVEKGFTNPTILSEKGPSLADNEEAFEIYPPSSLSSVTSEAIKTFFVERGFMAKKQSGFGYLIATKRWGPCYNVLVSPERSVKGDIVISVFHIKTGKAALSPFRLTTAIAQAQRWLARSFSGILEKKKIA